MTIAIAVAATGPARSEEPLSTKVERNWLNEGCCMGICKKERWHVSDAPAPPEPLASALTLNELATEMRKVEAGVDACGRAVNAAPGRILVNLVVHGDGRVTAASVTGRLANTPLAWCAERTVRSIQFRRNSGLSLTYPFSFRAGKVKGCGGDDQRVNAAALDILRVPLALCGGTQATKVSVQFALGADDVIRDAEAKQPSGARDSCVERVLACVLGSVAHDLPVRWEVGIERQMSQPATIRPLDPPRPALGQP